MWLSYGIDIIIFASLAVSVNLLVGYAGQLSVAHAAFAAIGGYTVGYLTSVQGWQFLPAVLAGAAIAGVIGLLLGLPALRLSTEYLILLTLGFTLVTVGIVAAIPQLGGSQGLTAIANLDIFGFNLNSPAAWLGPSLILLAVVFAICWRLGESPYGRVLKGIREDSIAMQALGKNVFWYRVGVFGITAACAGAAGGFMSGWLGIATPGLFGFNFAMTIFAMVILGGTGRLLGSLVGAVVLTLLTPVLQQLVRLEPTVASQVQLALYGVGLVLVVMFRPQGLLPQKYRSTARSARAITSADTENLIPETPRVSVARVPDSGSAQRRSQAPIVLSARGVTKNFGGIAAVQDLALDLRRGTITALVGPNGAGKTTVFNLLTGFITPDAGEVKLGELELVGRTPDSIARHGVVRTFQDVRLLQQLSCLENVMLGVQHQDGENIAKLFTPGPLVAARQAEVRDSALRWLEFVGMTEFATTSASSLSYGQSKLVSLARAMATEAPVLLLDEPASGVDPKWVEIIIELVERVRDEGRTVCIVEHNLAVVNRLADYTYFMQLGRVTAEGSIEELMSSPELAEAYFGGA